MDEGQTRDLVRLKDYRQSGYRFDSVKLIFDLGSSLTLVKSTIHVIRSAEKAEPLVLSGVDLTLISVAINGRVLSASDYAVDEESLTIHAPPEKFTLDVSVEINPKANASLSGLYVSGGNYCTQCEPHGFRHITYFLDRPDVLTRFVTKIIANKQDYPVLLANGNLVGSGQLDNGMHWTEWEDPSLKPCYLFALVAGQFAAIEDEFKTCSGRMVKLKIFAKEGNEDRCVFAMAALKRAMRWDEMVFKREYDLDIFMIAAVDDFNFGAMENKGLNIFNSKYILVDPRCATDMDFINVESVVAHEYFHNWTGNRITLRDWFQISLKEGLTIFRDQRFTADMRSPLIKRIQDVRVIRTAQFAEDAGPMAHPVRPEEYIEVNNLYTVTVYNKGSEVIRMIRTLIGASAFDAGIQIYFDRHDGQACTIEDFVCAMHEASGLDFQQFMRWYEQAGTPEVTIQTEDDRENNQLTLKVKQHCSATPGQPDKQPFMIPIVVGLLDGAGKELTSTLATDQAQAMRMTEHVLILTEQEQTFVLNQVMEKPHVSLMRDFCAPVKLVDDQTLETLSFLAMNNTDQFNRWDAGQNLMTRLILQSFELCCKGEVAEAPTQAVAYMRDLLTQSKLSDDVLAEMLVLPEKSYLIGQLNNVDVDALCDVYAAFMQKIGTQLYDEFEKQYQRASSDTGYRFTTEHIGARRLKSVCLQYMMQSGRSGAANLCSLQYSSADNMTDTMAALGALNLVECEERKAALDAFYRRWKHDTLVADKWFALQASAPLAGALDQVRGLLKHPDYSAKNPNRARAVLASFASLNLRAFHDLSGEGYQLLADEILKTDGFNPQLAARLAHPFTQWKRWDQPRQALLRREIQRMLDSTLSNNVFEVLKKSLDFADS